MHYDLNDLLEQLIAEKGVALYFIEQMTPVFAIRMDPTPTTPGETLLVVEAPELSRTDTLEILTLLGIGWREMSSKIPMR